MYSEPLQKYIIRKHLHIRGENNVSAATPNAAKETPPHTWRKWLTSSLTLSKNGNTSTYVEKIRSLSQSLGGERKHLHIRGENFTCFLGLIKVLETPPHTWRKFEKGTGIAVKVRNTSTYVEKIPTLMMA